MGVMNYWGMFHSARLLVLPTIHTSPEAALDSLYSLDIDRFAHVALYDTRDSRARGSLPDHATFQDAAADVTSRVGNELVIAARKRLDWYNLTVYCIRRYFV